MNRLGASAKVIAGGTDVVVDLATGRIKPNHLVDVSAIAELGGITRNGGALTIGPTTTHHALIVSPDVAACAPCLAEAAREVGSPQVRNLGTLGGNLASAVPSADLAPPAIAMGARLTLVGFGGERTVPAEEFFMGPRATVLKPDELLVRISIPEQPPRLGTKFLKFGRRKAMSLAVVNVAVAVALDENVEKVIHARIAVGAVAPVPLRVPKAEAVLIGKVPCPDIIDAAAEAACLEIRPIDDLRASADYRRTITRVLVRRAITEALQRARNSA